MEIRCDREARCSGHASCCVDGSMVRGSAVVIAFGCLIGLSVQGLAGAPTPAVPASPSEYLAIERFLAEIEKPPVSYQARRRLEASSSKLKESAWMEAVTEYDPAAGFTYSIVAQGGSERIQRRVLKAVLETEREGVDARRVAQSESVARELRVQFRRSCGRRHAENAVDAAPAGSRLVLGSALLTANVRKSGSCRRPSIEVALILGAVGERLTQLCSDRRLDDAGRVESTADVRIAGMSTFSMTYDYQMVDGRASERHFVENLRKPLAYPIPPRPRHPIPVSGTMLRSVAGIQFSPERQDRARRESPSSDDAARLRAGARADRCERRLRRR